MALRIKSHWHADDSDRSLGEIAGALAFIGWRIALDRAINLHCERFVYRSDEERLAVIQEYLCFLIQIADRLAHQQLEETERRELIVSLARRLAEHVQDNAYDLLGAGDHGRRFIDLLNERSAEYSDLSLTEDGPSYPFLRHLGYRVQHQMGAVEENRWVIDQVMDRDGWEAYRQFAKAFGDLLD